MFNILHCADLHLDATFAGQLPASAGNSRRAALRSTLSRILALAREHAADALTIAGDLFEHDYATLDTAEFLRQEFASLAPMRVLITPGERDPYTETSLYALTRWPDNVHVFPPGPLSPVALASNLTLWGAGCPPEPGHSTLATFGAGEPGVNLLLLHATLAGVPEPDGREIYRVDEANLRGTGIGFALLGHLHTARGRTDCAPAWIYPGSPEPLSLAEAEGDHQVILLTVDDGACTARGLPISCWRYHQVRVDLSGCTSTEEARAIVTGALQRLPGGVDELSICRITLTGRRHLDLDLEAIRERVGTATYVHFESRLPSVYDLDQVAQEQTVRGLLVRRLQDHLDRVGRDGDRAVPVQAVHLALRALDGRKVQPDESA
jgi:DNA repair exonuclease SbcCD nuclease subunit